MGLFDKLLKMGADKLAKGASNQISKAVDSVMSAGTDGVRSSSNSGKSTGSRKGNSLENKLETCFAAHFPDYEVRKNVSPTEIGGSLASRKFSYVLYLNGETKAIVMVTDHNGDREKEYKKAKAAAENAGIPFVNFFTQFYNKEDYIYNRLCNYLKASA